MPTGCVCQSRIGPICHGGGLSRPAQAQRHFPILIPTKPPDGYEFLSLFQNRNFEARARRRRTVRRSAGEMKRPSASETKCEPLPQKSTSGQEARPAFSYARIISRLLLQSSEISKSVRSRKEAQNGARRQLLCANPDPYRLAVSALLTLGFRVPGWQLEHFRDSFHFCSGTPPGSIVFPLPAVPLSGGGPDWSGFEAIGRRP
jgi:hypothetical protein